MGIQIDGKYQQSYSVLDPSYLSSTGKLEDIFKQNDDIAQYLLYVLLRIYPSLYLLISFQQPCMRTDRALSLLPALTLLTVIASKWVSDGLLATASLLRTQTFEYAENDDAGTNLKRYSPYISASIKPWDEKDFRLRTFIKETSDANI